MLILQNLCNYPVQTVCWPTPWSIGLMTFEIIWSKQSAHQTALSNQLYPNASLFCILKQIF
jgi:hypothetical protein